MPTSQAMPHQKAVYARTIDCNKLSLSSPFHWLSLAVSDFFSKPIISLTYGLIFSIIPFGALQVSAMDANPMLIIPLIVALALVGPIFSYGLYDVAWELEKGHTPTFTHSMRSILRNQIGLWGFAVMLLLLVTLWTLLAGLVFALYPHSAQPTFMELVAFLSLGSTLGGILLVVALVLSAFTPQIILERRVDIMTAVFSSANAVKNNFIVMFTWGAIILVGVTLGFLTSAIGFVIIMPILSFASWHAYIATIHTKKERTFE